VDEPIEYLLFWPSPLPCGCDSMTTTVVVDFIEGGLPRAMAGVAVESNVPGFAAGILRGLAHGEWPSECRECGAVFDEHELVRWFSDGNSSEECPS
jgi:hypothetical protein